MNVLFVDDDEVTLFLYQMLVNSLPDVKAFYAMDGEKALEIINREKSIDLVFTDLNMPVMDGFEFVKQNESLPSDIKAPAIFVMLGTGISDDKKLSVFQYSSVKNCIAKPLNAESFKLACLQSAK